LASYVDAQHIFSVEQASRKIEKEQGTMQETGSEREYAGRRRLLGAGRPPLKFVADGQDGLGVNGMAAERPLASDQESVSKEVESRARTAEKIGSAYVRQPGDVSISEEQERVIVEHLPIVRYLARRIHERLPQQVDIEDLVSSGVLGLIDALQKFDPAKKVQFRSYAQFRIRGAILDSLRTLDWSPRDLRRKGRAIEEAIRSLTSRLGRAPSETEVATELEMELSEYQLLLGELKGLEIGTLHAERSEDSGEEELAYIPTDPQEDPLFRCLKGEMQARLARAIDQLPERERLVMTLYYYEEMTMKEIGLTLGVVESRVSQIHASAVLHLRAGLSDLKKDVHATQAGEAEKALVGRRSQG
jgi:RNA polymerase sigma factor FliA